LKKGKKGGGGGVAVKVFRDDTSPDGRAIDELEVLCLVDHPNLTKVRALLIDTHTPTHTQAKPSDTQASQPPTQSPTRPIGVIMDLVTGTPLAAKPNHTSVLRCRWDLHAQFPIAFVLRCARDVASALEHLHSKGICHGDVYGHNVVCDGKGNATLLDYGASFVYASPAPAGGVSVDGSENGSENGGGEEGGGIDFERLEVRAYGLLVADLLQRVSEKKKSAYSFSSSASPLSPSTAKVMAAARGVLEEVVAQCLLPSVKERPTFAMICKRFHY
jgi:serine/threonine protein kinase